MSNKAKYSILKRDGGFVSSIWFVGDEPKITHTEKRSDAACWCPDCKDQGYDKIPDKDKPNYLVMVNPPVKDGWLHMCRGCDKVL